MRKATLQACGLWIPLRDHAQVRAVHDVSGTSLFVQTRRHFCSNPRCAVVKDQLTKSVKQMEKAGEVLQVAPVGEDGKRAVTAAELAFLREGNLDGMELGLAEAMVAAFVRRGVGFSINTPQYMKLLPAEVQQGYSFVLFTVGGASNALLEKTVIGMQSSSALQRELQEVYDYQQTRMMLQYAAFTQTEGTHEGGMKWPAFRPVGSGGLLSAPSYVNLETYCDHKFTEVEPHMHALVCSRHPGTNMSYDGTYKIANMSQGAAKVAMIAMGELGHIMGYAFVPSESCSNLLPFWAGLASRFERLGKQGVLETTSSDLCCEGREDPKQSVLAWLLGLERGSCCDGFHKVQQLTTSVFSPHPLLAEFSKQVGEAVCKRHERDVFRVMNSLVESGSTVAEAAAKARSASNKKHIRTSHPSNMGQRLTEIRDDFQKKSDEGVARGDKPFFLPRRGAELSTVETFASVLTCWDKGCFHSDRSIAELYFEDRVGEQTGLPFYCKVVSTSGNEALHSKLNTRVVTKSTNMGQDRTDREMLIFTHAHNCGTDIARGICKQDVYGNRTWVEQEIAAMWTNIDGPIPGGTLMMPSARPDGSPWTQEDWAGKGELFGNAYLVGIENGELQRCAERMGIDLSSVDTTAAMKSAVRPPSSRVGALAEERPDPVRAQRSSAPPSLQAAIGSGIRSGGGSGS
ncbi:unnamed protein product, partial [Scytosiphon promiscuus]